VGQKQGGQLIKIQCTEKVKIVEQTQYIFLEWEALIFCIFTDHSVMSRTATSEQKIEKKATDLPLTKILIRMNNDTKLTGGFFCVSHFGRYMEFC